MIFRKNVLGKFSQPSKSLPQEIIKECHFIFVYDLDKVMITVFRKMKSPYFDLYITVILLQSDKAIF